MMSHTPVIAIVKLILSIVLLCCSCWLNEGYRWAFAVPVVIVVVFNIVVLSLSIRRSRVLQNDHKNGNVKRKVGRIALLLQGSLNLTVIMGITWAFGFLMLVDYSEIAHLAAYVFTLFNAAQGIFILAFHVAANKQILRKFSVFSTKSSSAHPSRAEHLRSTAEANMYSSSSGRRPITR